ncbi:hypothetical protein D3C73_984260 [compost metagenome]
MALMAAAVLLVIDSPALIVKAPTVTSVALPSASVTVTVILSMLMSAVALSVSTAGTGGGPGCAGVTPSLVPL